MRFNEIGPHSKWFCKTKPILGKKELLGRNWLLQEDVKASTADLEAQFEALEKRLDKEFGKRESEISVQETTKEVLYERLDFHEKRITDLELPITR